MEKLCVRAPTQKAVDMKYIDLDVWIEANVEATTEVAAYSTVEEGGSPLIDTGFLEIVSRIISRIL